MAALAWFGLVASVAGIAFALWRLARRQAERRRESEARSAAMLAEAAAAIAKARGPKPGGPG